MSPEDRKELNLRLLFPYPLVPIADKKSGSIIYSFETDSQVKYELVFKSDSAYLPDNEIAEYAYSFVMTKVSDKEVSEDYRVKDTVVHSLNLALQNNPNLIITYVCSTENNQEKQRARLFRRWFRQYGAQYESRNFSNSESLYAIAIFKKDHPLRDQIIQTFDSLYQNK